jgi:hypothetical protein
MMFTVCVLLCHDVERRMNGDTPEPTGTLSGSRLRQAALRREQWVQLESNHRESQATGKKVEADQRRHKHSPRERNGCTPVDYLG